jgi:hypothetical protein
MPHALLPRHRARLHRDAPAPRITTRCRPVLSMPVLAVPVLAMELWTGLRAELLSLQVNIMPPPL